MQIGLGFDPYADELTFLVAYPDAYDGARWNDGRGTLESSALGVDDVNFIVSMVSDIADEWPVDPARVFVTGASNGGIMAYRLGCETSGVFAAIAPVIGNIAQPIGPHCAPQPPISILSINGNADPYIPFDGGEVCEEVRRGCEKGFVLSTAASLANFALANRCSTLPRSEMLPPSFADGTSIEKVVYVSCAQGAQVELYVVHGGGHTWPPREPQLSSGGTSTKNLDATDLIVRFFVGDG
jgi:polyhydroxybutyrate depolymerase